MNAFIEQKMPQIEALCKKYHVARLWLFGSATTDKFTEESDFDFLYLFDENLPLEDYVDNFLDFAESLKALMGREVDMVGENDMHNPHFIKNVEKSKQLLYAA
jgi:predicted nucleotidyltransferase